MLSTRNLFEGKALRYAGAIASGLTGPFIGGSVGAYQANQKTEYAKQIARQKGDVKEETEQQKKHPGRMVGRSLLGMIPGVGAVSNLDNQMKLEKQKEELKRLADKKK
jgi:hypothetical protein